ncbi:MAG: GldG family protein [Lewinellaceae bacterium]|nr:GldG family protein [Lewinellaceae bacterium]
MKKTTVTIILLAGIIIIINLISRQLFFRFDLTEDKQYTLSKATKNILRSLDEPVTVKAYFSEDLPPNISKTRKDFEDFLIEYNRLSNGNVVYEFINPNEDDEKEQEALKAGVQPVMINVRDKDQVKQQKAFLGAVLELGEQREVIPFIQPGAPLEYAMSTSIKKMTVIDKPSIGLIQGHGEPSLGEMYQVQAGLNVLYDVEPYTIQDTTPIPERFRTLAIVRPTDSIPPGQLAQLDAFLERGGNLFVALNRVEGDLQNAMGTAVNTGLETWLASKGIIVDDYFIVDSKCGAVTVQQQQGFFRIASKVKFPFLPIISIFADHPISKGLEAVVLPFASPVRFSGDTSATFTSLAFTSGKSGALKAPQYFDIQKQWTDNDFPLQNQVVAGVLEKTGQNGQTWRLCVVGDGDFAVNGPREQSQQLQDDNVNLMVNAIDWLSDDTGLIELRTKGIQYRPLDELDEGTKSFLKYLNFLLPIILLAGYGVVRSQINRNKRIRRMQENYE